MPRSIVLVVDGLRASWLGPYGNTWFDTPVANQLATEALTYQHCLADAARLEDIYQSYWHGRRFDRPAQPHLAELLREAGTATYLVTDAVALADSPLASAFMHGVEPPEPASLGEAAEDIWTTASGLTAGAALQSLSSLANEDFHAWIHLAALSATWDAPRELRQRLAEQEEMEPFRGTTPPARAVQERLDPDTRLTWLIAAAAEVQVIDQTLAWLLEFAVSADALLVVTGARGYPLGEHGGVGLAAPQLFAELLQVPLMVRRPDGAGACRRVYPLVQGAEVRDLVLAWHNAEQVAPVSLSEQMLPDPARQLAVARHKQQWGIRTAAWYARLAGSEVELFCKPDDQFEINEVADRCSDEVRAMREVAAKLSAAENGPAEISLPEPLWNPPR